jgi:cholesterol 7-dehydrogenase
VLGLDVAVFRTEHGDVGVVEAYCPHLGANLAAGGIVEGDTLVCPFHGWEFNCDGKCVKIPYAKDPTKTPAEARVKKYTSMEINDQILVWYVFPTDAAAHYLAEQ